MATESGGSVCGFLLQVLRGRWFMMFASFLIMAGAGATYLFGVYSKEIKVTLGYDQTTLNILSTCKDLRQYRSPFRPIGGVYTPLVRPSRRCRHELRRLFHDLARRGEENRQTKGLANMYVHLYRGKFSEFRQHWLARHLR